MPGQWRNASAVAAFPLNNEICLQLQNISHEGAFDSFHEWVLEAGDCFWVPIVLREVSFSKKAISNRNVDITLSPPDRTPAVEEVPDRPPTRPKSWSFRASQKSTRKSLGRGAPIGHGVVPKQEGRVWERIQASGALAFGAASASAWRWRGDEMHARALFLKWPRFSATSAVSKTPTSASGS